MVASPTTLEAMALDVLKPHEECVHRLLAVQASSVWLKGL